MRSVSPPETLCVDSPTAGTSEGRKRGTMRVIKRLGAGGFGYVDLVEDQDGKRYARKTFQVAQNLPPQLLENAKKRFIREAHVQQSLDHRNIVPVIDVSMENGSPSYLMPVAISTLADDLDADRTISGNWRAALNDVIAGLEVIHRLDMTHRDLKPANILRFKDNLGDYYAISDFGFISIRDSRVSELTYTGLRMGSDYYTAPEITADLSLATEQSDIYALGCILHDMVGTGTRYPCREIEETGPYGAIMEICTRFEPVRRFGSVRVVADAVLAIEDGGVSTLTPESSDFVEHLRAKTPLDNQTLKHLLDFLDSPRSERDRGPLLLAFTEGRIREVREHLPEHLNKLGRIYARWVEGNSFDFGTCDPLADRLQILAQSCTLSVRAECLLALLRLGTSHNRWYVERKFMELCGSDMDDVAAQRLAIEFRAANARVCRMIDHLEMSIDTKRDQLHPALIAALNDICV